MIGAVIAREIGRARHRAYLRSAEWQRLRRLTLIRDGHRCTGCGVSDAEHRRRHSHGLDVHHTRYPRWWESDRLEWLVTLCRGCHKSKHGRRFPVLSATITVAALVIFGLLILFGG